LEFSTFPKLPNLRIPTILTLSKCFEISKSKKLAKPNRTQQNQTQNFSEFQNPKLKTSSIFEIPSFKI
jgi:hypothetical protein